MPADGGSRLTAILPTGVAVSERDGDDRDAALFPEEEAAVRRAIDSRRLEFATGRACARDALAKLGAGSGPIPVGHRGQPCWPAGIVGSITHCDGYRGAAVARSVDFAAIGIDAEPNEDLPERLLEEIALPGERVWLDELAANAPGVCWGRLLFSIKESVFKAWFPLAGRRLGFGDATASIEGLGEFSVRLRVSAPASGRRAPLVFSGCWLVDGPILATATAIRASKGIACPGPGGQ